MHGWRLIITAAACIATVFLDQVTSGANAAVAPYMEGSTGVSVDEGRWLTSGYLLPYLVVLLLTPYLIGRFGRRLVWTAGTLVFAVACIGFAASSVSFGWLVFWHFVQGLGQGTFFVCAVSTVITIFPPQIAFLGLASFASIALSGAGSASAVGGYFIDTNQWTTMYLVFAALAVFACVIVHFNAPEIAPVDPQPPFDGFGVALALTASLAFTYIAQFGEPGDWLTNPIIAGFAALIVAAGIALILWEGHFARAPFLDLRIFGFHNLRYGAMLGFALGVPLFGATTLVEYLQSSLQFSASLAGGEIAVRSITIFLVVPVVAFVLTKNLVDPRALMIPGFALVAISYVLQYFGTTSTAYFGTFVASVLISGAGFGMLFSPIATSFLGTLPQTLFTRGIALFKFLLVCGGTFATTVLQVVVDHRQTLHSTELGSALQPGVPTYDTLVLNSHLGTSEAVSLAPLLSQQSSTLAYADSFLYTAILVLVIAPLALIIQPPPKSGS